MSDHLTLQVDPRSHSMYIYLRPIREGGVAKTERVGEGMLADFGRRGQLLGVELLGSKAVGRMFSIASRQKRFKGLRELASKRGLLQRLIA